MKPELPMNAIMIRLTNDYNTSVKYYGWPPHDAWPIVTDMGELELQPLLKDNLSHYPSKAGDGYILFNLRKTA